MSYLEQQIVEELNGLPLQDKQRVLEFVRGLRSQIMEISEDQQLQPEQPKMFGEVIHKYAGRVDSGIPDLATNKAHMEGFGKK